MKLKIQLQERKRFQILSAFLLLILPVRIFAQSPEVSVKGEDAEKVRMTELLVDVKIVGNIAYTTAEMHFFNSSNRQMEAELIFPLPENVSVSRYAIDINGKMRDAVPVNKSKGKQVFEAIEHRRVDPGLLEKVDGNNFRTRVYPLMPNNKRIVIIGYEQELPSLDANNLAYNILSRYPKKLDNFEVKIAVIGASSKPTIVENSSEINFESWNQTFQASIKKENYRPEENLTVKIPKDENSPSILMQNLGGQHYFYGTIFVENTKMLRPQPKTIGLIWDNSLSAKSRNMVKELAFLDAYFQKIKNTKVTLYFANYNVEKQREFAVVNGDWTALKTALQNTKYDGGTRFSQISFGPEEEYFIFSDGLSSLSENTLPKTKKVVHTITSSASADFSFLNFSAVKTSGNFINLNQISVETAVDKMWFTGLKFLGIKENRSVLEIFPSYGTPVAGNFGFAGISLSPLTEVTLQFGYNGTVFSEKKITLDLGKQRTDLVSVEKLWAQKKIADLELQYTKNADEIEMLGKKFGIVTRNTSLIVLEDIRDYIAYDIVPPTELRAEFDRIKKQEQDSRLAEKHSNWENIDSYFSELKNWWNLDQKYVAPKKVKAPKVSRNAPQIVYEDEKIDGVKDEAAPVLEEVVVMGYNAERKQSTSNAVQSINSEALEKSVNVDVVQTLQGQVPGVQVSENNVQVRGLSSLTPNSGLIVVDGEIFNGKLSDIDEDEIISVDVLKGEAAVSLYGNRAVNGVTIVRTMDDNRPKRWNPDRLYLQVLANTPKEKQLETYFELKKDQERNPSFYFDVAHFFHNNGNTKMALQILSNIADLGLENHQLYKTLSYTLRQWKSFDDAIFAASKIAQWREHEPQSLRDYALALEDGGKNQEAFDQLIKALEVNYYGEMSGQYAGVEDIILMDLNRIASKGNIKTGKLDKKYLSKMPVDVRIVMNWNLMDVDLDLHVVEPTGEECYYGNNSTQIGARFSKDFTQGYGPEQYLLRNATKGKYQLKTNYYGESELTESGPATVMLEIYTTKAGRTTKEIKTIQLSKVQDNGILAEIAL